MSASQSSPLAEAQKYHQLIQQRVESIYNILKTNPIYEKLHSNTKHRLDHIYASEPYIHDITTIQPAQPVSSYIDHTVLKADATYNDIELLCNQARQYQFRTVCVNSG